MSSNIYSHLGLDQKDLKEFKKRRRNAQKQLEGNEVLICFSSSLKQRSRDTEYPFKQNTNFYYLTGLSKSEGILYLTRNKEILFLKQRSALMQKWMGKSPGVKQFTKEGFFEQTLDITEFDQKLFSGFYNVIFPWFEEKNQSLSLWSQLTSSMRRNMPRATKDLNEFLMPLRRKKSAWEIKKIKKSCQIAVKAHNDLKDFVRPGLNEKELADFLNYRFCFHGAEGVAYDTIMASGDNANTLHYIENNQELKNGDLLLVDAGCEFEGYASDITRTYPVNSEWTKPQRLIAEIVAEAQRAAIKMMKPGMKWSRVDKKSREVLAKGLREEKILKGSVDKILKSTDFQQLYPHSLGHSLGLDVHDPFGDYHSLVLESGMVMTVEPGLYFEKNNRNVPKEFRGIGVRLEDDVLVTSSGKENLTDRLDLL